MASYGAMSTSFLVTCSSSMRFAGSRLLASALARIREDCNISFTSFSLSGPKYSTRSTAGSKARRLASTPSALSWFISAGVIVRCCTAAAPNLPYSMRREKQARCSLLASLCDLILSFMSSLRIASSGLAVSSWFSSSCSASARVSCKPYTPISMSFSPTYVHASAAR